MLYHISDTRKKEPYKSRKICMASFLCGISSSRLLSALERTAAGILTVTGIGAGNTDGTCFTGLMIVERTFAGHASHLYIGISAAVIHGVGFSCSFLETCAAGFIDGFCIFSVHLNSISGAKLPLIVHTFCSRTF